MDLKQECAFLRKEVAMYREIAIKADEEAEHAKTEAEHAKTEAEHAKAEAEHAKAEAARAIAGFDMLDEKITILENGDWKLEDDREVRDAIEFIRLYAHMLILNDKKMEDISKGVGKFLVKEGYRWKSGDELGYRKNTNANNSKRGKYFVSDESEKAVKEYLIRKGYYKTYKTNLLD